MILSDLLSALSSNANVNVTLLDSNDNNLITFNAAGYAAVESDLGKRTVKRVKINTAQQVTISVDDAAPEPEPEPTPDPDNNADPTGDP